MKKTPDVSPSSSRISLSRRQLAKGTAIGAVAAGSAWMARSARASEEKAGDDGTRIPLKIGHRAANMKMVGDFGVFKMARQIPGLMGVELQVASGRPNLRDWDVVRRYKKQANRWGMMVPSVAGVWDRGVSIMRSSGAAANLEQSVQVARFLGSSVVLVAFFRSNAPDMKDKSSYGPVVELLKRTAPLAADAGVTLGLENSLSPADNKKLVDMVEHPGVKVYYDPHNMAHYGYAEQAVPGIKLLGKDRICQVHVKNGERLIAEPGLVDWRAALNVLNEIGYEGWYVFESTHTDHAQVIDATTRNIEFLKKHCRMPLG
jgi:L-ribulose-5-phosphate 3-epimerase